MSQNRNPIIYILVEGGVVQNIWSDQPENVQVILVDRDDGSAHSEVIINDPYPADFASEETMEGWLSSWGHKCDNCGAAVDHVHSVRHNDEGTIVTELYCDECWAKYYGWLSSWGHKCDNCGAAVDHVEGTIVPELYCDECWAKYYGGYPQKE